MIAHPFTLGYGIGLLMGAVIAWFLMSQRMGLSPDMRKIVNDSCTQAAFISAASEVLDDDKCIEIKQRANERLDELDIPGSPQWHFKDS